MGEPPRAVPRPAFPCSRRPSVPMQVTFALVDAPISPRVSRVRCMRRAFGMWPAASPKCSPAWHRLSVPPLLASLVIGTCARPRVPSPMTAALRKTAAHWSVSVPPPGHPIRALVPGRFPWRWWTRGRTMRAAPIPRPAWWSPPPSASPPSTTPPASPR